MSVTVAESISAAVVESVRAAVVQAQLPELSKISQILLRYGLKSVVPSHQSAAIYTARRFEMCNIVDRVHSFT